MKDQKMFPEWRQCDSRQIRGLIKERNVYRRLLDECLYLLNNLPNRRISDGSRRTTYNLASDIEKAFRYFEQGGSNNGSR